MSAFLGIAGGLAFGQASAFERGARPHAISRQTDNVVLRAYRLHRKGLARPAATKRILQVAADPPPAPEAAGAQSHFSIMSFVRIPRRGMRASQLAGFEGGVVMAKAAKRTRSGA